MCGVVLGAGIAVTLRLFLVVRDLTGSRNTLKAGVRYVLFSGW